MSIKEAMIRDSDGGTGQIKSAKESRRKQKTAREILVFFPRLHYDHGKHLQKGTIMPRWIFLCIGALEALYIAGVFFLMIRKDQRNQPRSEGEA